MAYTLDTFATACRQALTAFSGPEGREQVRQLLKQVLQDKAFLAEYLGPDNTRERDVIYEDPELGFCICTHVYQNASQGRPHDHGPTWAIYGQAEGETEMSDWERISAPDADPPVKVRQTRTYRLQPGDAYLYEIGDVHAPMRSGPTKLLRIEGQNTDKIQRSAIEASQ